MPRPQRIDYPGRPRVAMIAVAPNRPWSERMSAEALAEWFEAAGAFVAQDAPVDWVERTHLELAREELERAVAGGAVPGAGAPRSGGAALSLGRWAQCDLLLVGQVRADRRDGAEPDAAGLYLAAIDPATATRVATLNDPLPLPTGGPRTADVVDLASAAKQLLLDADARLRADAGKPVVMLLHFRNISRNDRLDRLNTSVPARLRELAGADGRLRLVQVDEPNRSLSEQELLLTGLLDVDPDAWSSVADAYLWGTAEEIAPGVEEAPDPAAAAGRDPESTPVRLQLHFWNGRDEAQTFEAVAPAREVDAAVQELAERAWAAAGRPLPDEVSREARRRVARLLAGDTRDRPRMPEFRFDDPAEGWRGRQFYYWLHAARAARFLDPRNPERAHAAVATGYPELAADPWAAVDAYSADLDRAIRQASPPAPVDFTDMTQEEADSLFDDGFMFGNAFLDLVERRLTVMMIRSASIAGQRTGHDIKHQSDFLHYIPPRLELPPDLTEQERTRWRAQLMADLARLGREWSRWSAAAAKTAAATERGRDEIESDLELFETAGFQMVTQLLSARKDERRIHLVRAIDAWWPLLESGVRQGWKNSFADVEPVAPAEQWPELWPLAESARHDRLRKLLRSPPASTADTQRSAEAEAPEAAQAEPTGEGWDAVRVSRPGETGAGAATPQEIRSVSVRSRGHGTTLEIRTRDTDGGQSTYRWRYVRTQASAAGRENGPAEAGAEARVPTGPIPAEFDAEDVRAWLARQRAAGRLQGGVLDKPERPTPERQSPERPRHDRARDPLGLHAPVHLRDTFARFDSLPPDMPDTLRGLVTEYRQKSRQRASEIVGLRDRQRRAMGQPEAGAQELVFEHAGAPIVEAHSLRVRMAAPGFAWPTFWPEPERAEFGPPRWFDGWLVSSVAPTRAENPRGHDANRGEAGYRALRWLHPVSLADRHPAVEFPEGMVVRDVAAGQTPGRLWVATYGNGLIRVNVSADGLRASQVQFSTPHGLVDQKLTQVVRVGDRLLAVAGRGASIVSDLDAPRPTFRDAEAEGLNLRLPATALGRYACFPGPGGGWVDPATGQLVLLSDWLEQHLPEPRHVRGGFVGDGATWIVLADRLVRIDEDLGSSHDWPLPVAAHDGMVGYAADGIVWLAYPDADIQIKRERNMVGHDDRPHDPKPVIEQPATPAKTGESRILAFDPRQKRLLGQFVVEGRVQQLTGDANDLFVVAPSGMWEMSVYPRAALLAALGEDGPVRIEDAREKQPFGASGGRPLIRAAAAGDADAVAAALAGGASPDEADERTGVTPLIAAARYGHSEVVERLLTAGADSQQKSELTPWIRPLMLSAMRDDAQTFATLVEADAITTGHNQRLGTETHAAVLHRSYTVLESLPQSKSLDRSARCVHATLTPANGHLTLKISRFRPMDLAVYRGDARAVGALVDAGQWVCQAVPGDEFITSLAHAATLDRGDLLRRMLADPRQHKHAVHGDSNEATTWDYCASFNRPDALSALLDLGVNPPRDPDLLLVAARAGSLEDLKRLAAAGLPIDHQWSFRRERTSRGRRNVGPREVRLTALTTAAANGHHGLIDPMVQMFGLDLDADLAGDRQHDIVLRIMLERGDLEAAIDRVAAGADVDGACHALDAATLLSAVVERGEPVAVEFLLRLGADPRAAGRDGHTALQMARTPEMKQLLESAPRPRRRR